MTDTESPATTAATAEEDKANESLDLVMPMWMLSDEQRMQLDVLMEQVYAMQRMLEVEEYVTPQVASEVLYCYGDYADTSEPSLANAALINLIRVCVISNDEYLDALNVNPFHGYVLAVGMYAERGADGMRVLRKIADLPVPVPEDEPAE